MRPLIAGNWKMHKTPSEGVAWLGTLLARLEDADTDHAEILLNVPATHIAPMASRRDETPRGDRVGLGGQDVSAHDEGAYTGEVSGAMLADAGAAYVVVGHSERRAYHDEDDALVSAKAQAARRHGLVPIVCVGESLEQREAGDAEGVVLRQLAASLDGVAAESAGDLVIAYEPIWAIGTGRTATADDAQAMCAAIRGALGERYGAFGREVRVLYGGSMKPGNAAELIAKPDIDGGLIGGASLDAASLLEIVAAAA